MTRLMFALPQKTCPNLILKEQWREFGFHLAATGYMTLPPREGSTKIDWFASHVSPQACQAFRVIQRNRRRRSWRWIYIYLAFNERFFGAQLDSNDACPWRKVESAYVTFYCIFDSDKIFNKKCRRSFICGVLRHFTETNVLEFEHNLHLKSKRLQSLVVIVAKWRWSVEITQGQTRHSLLNRAQK